MQKYRNIYRASMVKSLMAECQNYANKLHFVKSNEDVNNHFILMRIIYLIQQDVF